MKRRSIILAVIVVSLIGGIAYGRPKTTENQDIDPSWEGNYTLAQVVPACIPLGAPDGYVADLTKPCFLRAGEKVEFPVGMPLLVQPGGKVVFMESNGHQWPQYGCFTHSAHLAGHLYGPAKVLPSESELIHVKECPKPKG